MRSLLSRHLSTILVAMITAAVTAGGPALAEAVRAGLNADQVDGKHAVGAGATVNNRKGKLVATSGTTGRLPNDIIAKAPSAANADKLDGLNSTAFLAATATAEDSEMLDGKDSTEFLGAQDTAWDSDKLDGKDSTDFAPADHDHLNALGYAELHADGTIVAGSALNVTQDNIVVPRAGIYCFKDLSFTPNNMIAVPTIGAGFISDARTSLGRPATTCDSGSEAGNVAVQAIVYIAHQQPFQEAAFVGAPFTVVFH